MSAQPSQIGLANLKDCKFLGTSSAFGGRSRSLSHQMGYFLVFQIQDHFGLEQIGQFGNEALLNSKDANIIDKFLQCDL
jgi:hypothetical protein